MFNWNEIISSINALTSPKAGQNFILNLMSKKNPNLANACKQMINEGKNPSEVLTQYAASGKITLQQLAQIKNYYNLARRMGMKQQIPNEEWQKAEQAIRAGMQRRNPPMSGF